MGVVDESIEDGVGEGSIAQDIVPMVEGQLAGDECSPPTVAIFEDLEQVASFGLAHRGLDQVTALGVDEIQFGKGHHYLTLLYQIDTHRRRLLWMGPQRTKKTLDDGVTELEQEHQRKQAAAGSG